MNQYFKSKEVKERWMVYQPTNRQQLAINGKWKGVQCDWIIYYSSVQSPSHAQLLPPHGLQHVRLRRPSPAPRVCSNLCPSSRWHHPTISSFVIPFSSCLQSFPASGTFPVSRLFLSGGQRIGASASATGLPMNSWGWFPLGLTGLISLLSEGLLRVFFSTTIRKQQFFTTQPSLWSNYHIRTWLLEKP